MGKKEEQLIKWWTKGSDCRPQEGRVLNGQWVGRKRRGDEGGEWGPVKVSGVNRKQIYILIH